MSAARIPARTAASVEQLQTIKDVDAEQARAIRAAWHTMKSRRDARDCVDILLRTFGVEWLGRDRRSGEDVYYCNAGDTYATTVLFIGPRLIVGCWGDLVERERINAEPVAY